MAREQRALLVTPTSPWGPSFGAQQRTALLYQALAKELPVDILLIDEGMKNEASGADRPEILAKLVWKQPPFTIYKYKVNAWADGWCRSNIDWKKYSLVAGRYVTPITKVDWPRHVRTLVDCDDACYRYTPERDNAFGRAAASARSWLRYRQTRRAITQYDHAFFCSLRDRRLFPAKSSSVLPNVVKAPPAPPVAPNGPSGTALIVGSMWYAPNRQGVDWFLERCWPAVAARCPALNLRIVGPAPAEVRERWARAGQTEAPGFVENLAAEYERASFAIAPIHYGGGTCIKFLEAAAFVRACIVTGHVFAAFDSDFRAGYSVAVANDDRQMIEGCVALFENAQRRGEIARRAHETVTKLYSVERFTSIVQDAVRKLMSPRHGVNESCV